MDLPISRVREPLVQLSCVHYALAFARFSFLHGLHARHGHEFVAAKLLKQCSQSQIGE